MKKYLPYLLVALLTAFIMWLWLSPPSRKVIENERDMYWLEKNRVAEVERYKEQIAGLKQQITEGKRIDTIIQKQIITNNEKSKTVRPSVINLDKEQLRAAINEPE